MNTALPAPQNDHRQTGQTVAPDATPLVSRPRRALLIALCILLQPLPAYADILVGIAAPQNEQGADIRGAAKAAIKRINAEGGVRGERIALIESDDGCNSEQGMNAAQSLVERGAIVVIGHPCASATNVAAPVYASNNVVLLSMSRHPALTEQRAGATIFRVSGRDDRQGASASAYLSRNFPGKPIAVVHDPSRYARRIASDTRAALRNAGFAEVLSVGIRGGQKDYTKLIAKMQKANTEAVFFAGFPLEAGLLLRQMRAAGLRTVFVGSDTLAPAQFADTAGSAAFGARILMLHDPAREPIEPHLRDTRDGRPPTGPYLTIWAAIEVWRAAVRSAGSTAPDAVSTALQTGTFETILGPISFAENGDATIPAFDIVTWNMDAWRGVD